MITARKLSKINSRSRLAAQIFLRATHDQIVSSPTVVETSQHRLNRARTVASAQEWQDVRCSEIDTLDRLAPGGNEVYFIDGGGCDDQTSTLEHRRRSNAEASSSNGSGRSSSNTMLNRGNGARDSRERTSGQSTMHGAGRNGSTAAAVAAACNVDVGLATAVVPPANGSNQLAGMLLSSDPYALVEINGMADPYAMSAALAPPAPLQTSTEEPSSPEPTQPRSEDLASTPDTASRTVRASSRLESVVQLSPGAVTAQPQVQQTGSNGNGASASGAASGSAVLVPGLQCASILQNGASSPCDIAAMLQSIAELSKRPGGAAASGGTKQVRRQRRSWQASNVVPGRVAASPSPDVTSASALTRLIVSAQDVGSLQRVYAQNRRSMNVIHTSAMMKRLGQLCAAAPALAAMASVEQTPAQMRQRQQETERVQQQRKLWSALCEKAIFMAPDATARQVADMLLAVVLMHQKPAVPEVTSEDKAGMHQTQSQPPQQQQPAESAGQAPAADSSSDGDEDSAGRSTRPLSSFWVLPLPEQQLVQTLLHHSADQLSGPASARPKDLAKLAANVGRLCAPTSETWQDAFFAATEHRLQAFSRADLTTLAYGISRMSCSPPASWVTEFHARSQPLLRSLSTQELCILLAAVASLPKAPASAWLDELLLCCVQRLDEFDAPAYALLVHSLGCMDYRPAPGFTEEFMDSSATLLHDFSPEELSLMLKGCCMLHLIPNEGWLADFYYHSKLKLRFASATQLADMGWALAQLRSSPPRHWLHDWTFNLGRRLDGKGPFGDAPAAMQAAVGPISGPLNWPEEEQPQSRRRKRAQKQKQKRAAQQQQQQQQQQGPKYVSSLVHMSRVHAKRAAQALLAFRVRDVAGWCRRMDIRVPEPLRPVWPSSPWSPAPSSPWSPGRREGSGGGGSRDGDMSSSIEFDGDAWDSRQSWRNHDAGGDGW